MKMIDYFAWLILITLSAIHPSYANEKTCSLADGIECIKLEESINSQPCVIVIFGATGDLTSRKLLPAIYHLTKNEYLSANTPIIGFARQAYTNEEFRDKMGIAIDNYSRTKEKDVFFWDQFKQHLFYTASDFENDQGYEKLALLLDELDQKFHTNHRRLYYLATQPSYFPTIIQKLSQHHLMTKGNEDENQWSRVIIEKPFGFDASSALQLSQHLLTYLDETQIYCIDHYLGKEGVQNLLSLRFQNIWFEPIWNAEYIDHIQMTLAEDIGIGSRAYFWEETGYLRDIFQNHILQMLALLTMEKPIDLKATSIQAEKIKVLQAIRAFDSTALEYDIVRAQYQAGKIQDQTVLGYHQEKNVSPFSQAETYIAARLWIDNPRWRNVPFYIRGGKRLAKQTTEIAVVFKKSLLAQSTDPNILFIRIQPHPGIFFKALSKVPGLRPKILPVIFGFTQEDAYHQDIPEAYEKLIYDCILGHQHAFVTLEEQLATWKLLTPILDDWKSKKEQQIQYYEAGGWGPHAADNLLFNLGHQWLLLDP